MEDEQEEDVSDERKNVTRAVVGSPDEHNLVGEYSTMNRENKQ
jgi:hypothetical protein